MDNKQISLIRSLLVRTEEGRIDWKKTADPNVFLAIVGDYVIKVVQESNFNQRDGHRIDIANSDAETVESIGFELLNDEERQAQGPTLNRQIERIYELARRRAHGADKAIDAILGELNAVS